MTEDARVDKSETRTPWASRQRQAGELVRQETRRLVLEAAREEFGQHGYAAATVRRIAERAHVSVQSVYSAWGSKRDLLRGVMAASLTGDTQAPLDAADMARRWAEGLAEDADPATVLRHLAAAFCRTAESAATGWSTYLDAIGTDPGIAADWQELMTTRRASFVHHTARIPDQELRPGLDPRAAADTAWVIASPQTYDLLVRRAAYPMPRFQAWLGDTLCAALLKGG